MAGRSLEASKRARSMPRRGVLSNPLILVGLAVLVVGLLPWGARQGGGVLLAQVHQGTTGYTPHRVYDTRAKRFIDLEAMLLDLSRADLVFVGEQHDDPASHRLERAILEGLARRRGDLIVSLEMFERDVQSPLDDYLAGRLTEESFLAAARPWPNYQSDYRPLVELAKVHQWPVLASNIPRKYASRVSREGAGFLTGLPSEERGLIARESSCPMDDYFQRFVEAMSSHPSGNTQGQPAKSGEKAKKSVPDPRQQSLMERFYLAQCLKDETMAESIVARFAVQGQSSESRREPLIVHFNGAFHSDFRLGTASRVERRAPKQQLKTVTLLPVADLDQLDPKPDRKRADYLVYTMRPRTKTGMP
jgi:uncharacterized iron-regulated protein